MRHAMSTDTFAVTVAAVMIAADLAACGALLAWRAWHRRPSLSARWAAERRCGLNDHQPDISAAGRDLRRLLADAEADEFDAIVRAVTDNDGKAL
jgi:hypothetical protein